jgi:hypothetical protein
MAVKLMQRFQRLTLWNKINVLGAIASTVGIALSILFWQFPGSSAERLAYPVAFDVIVIELPNPYHLNPEQQLLDGVEPFPAVPYYSDTSNHPTAWPPRVARDRHAFADKVSVFLNEEDVKRGLDSWEGSGAAPNVQLISATGRSEHVMQMERYARLRMYYSGTLGGDLSRLSDEFGKTFSERFAVLERKREELKGRMPNRLLIMRFENQNKFDVHDLCAELFVAGDVYDATLNSKAIITSQEGIMEPIVAKVGTLRPRSSAEMRIWYAYLPLGERAFPGPNDIRLEQTQGVVIRNLAVSDSHVSRDKRLLTTFDAYHKFDVELRSLRIVH